MQYQQLHKALTLLPEDERTLIEQLYFEGRTVREIADERGIFHNVIQKQKNRILDKLKKKIKKISILGCTRCSANVEVSEGENISPC
ncbi:sigma factor-like helix-turn-helix DNA-binding protein [Enterocloster clostridioformis]|nr:sigma factor-like helix-turn-helix DNA-binding protein [Enterocloster clostridioformis]